MSGDIKSREVRPRSIIFREGDAADGAYVILEGEVRIYMTRSGHETTLAVLKAGDIFGEMALLDGKPRSASAITTDLPVRLRYITPDEFRTMLSDQFVWQLVTEMGKRLRTTIEELNRLETADAARHDFVSHRSLRDWAV